MDIEALIARLQAELASGAYTGKVMLSVEGGLFPITGFGTVAGYLPEGWDMVATGENHLVIIGDKEA